MPPVRNNLASAPTTTAILQDDYVFVRQGNSVKRITLENFENSMNAGDAELLREVAWGVQCKQHTQSSPQWTAVGNQTMKAEFLSSIGRFLLTNSGKAAKLSVANSGVFADGTTLNEALGHVMFISPKKLYYRVVVDAQTGIPTIWWSMLPIGGHHFRENMCGQKTCCTTIYIFFYQFKKSILYQRIKPSRRFIEYKKLRFMLHGTDYTHLLFISV